MQTFGSWLKIPIVAIIIQAAIFLVLHRYDLSGSISVFCIGLSYGFLVWYGQGLEAASAMHALHNIIVFLSIGLGFQNSLSDISAFGVIGNIAMMLIPIVILIILDKKFNWGLQGDVN